MATRPIDRVRRSDVVSDARTNGAPVVPNLAARVLRQQAYVFDLAYRLLGSRDRAQEVTQEILIDACQRIATLGRMPVDQSWFTRVTLERCRAERGRSRKTREARSPEQAREEAPPVDEDEDQKVAERRALVRQAVASLKAEAREVIVLCDMEGMSRESAAAVLGIASEEVRDRLRKGRRQLHERLRGQLQQEV